MVNGRQKHEVLRTQEATTSHRQIVDEFEAKEGQSLFIINVHLNPCVQAPKVVQRIDRSLKMLPHPLFKVERCNTEFIDGHWPPSFKTSNSCPKMFQPSFPGRKDGCNSRVKVSKSEVLHFLPLQRVRCCGLVHVTRENKSATQTLVLHMQSQGLLPRTQESDYGNISLNKDDALSPRLHRH